MPTTYARLLESLPWARMRFEVKAVTAVPLCLPESVVRREISSWHGVGGELGSPDLPVLVLPAAIHSAVGRHVFRSTNHRARELFKGSATQPAAILLDPIFEPENGRFEWPVREAGRLIGGSLPENGLVFEPTERLSFSFTLIGPAIQCARDIADAVVHAGHQGIGGRLVSSARGQFTVEGAELVVAPPASTPTKCTTARLTFLSPWVGMEEPPTFETLWKAILNRIVRQLDSAFGAGHLAEWPFERFADRQVSALAREFLAQAWVYRFPVREAPSGKDLVEGFGGVIDYAGNLDDYMPLLQLAAELGVGQNTGMGCGRFYLEPIA